MTEIRRTEGDVSEQRCHEDRYRLSERQLRLAQRVAGIGTFEWNIQTGVNVWTPELEAMYGLPAGGFPGTQSAWENLVHPDDRERVLGQVQQAFASAKPAESEWRVIWPDGTVHWLRGCFQVFKDDSGRPMVLTGVNIDITEKKRAESAIRESEERFRTLVVASAEVVWRADARGEPIGENLSWRQFTGQSLDDIRAGRWAEAVHPDDRAAAMELVSHALIERVPYRIENRLRRFDGEWRHMTVRGVPILEEDGSVREWVGYCQDITDRKRADETLRESEEFLKAVLDALSAHVAILDASGNIVAVNAAWRAFGRANALAPNSAEVGCNYLKVCESAEGTDSGLAGSAANGIRDVLACRLASYHLEYPCHSPAEQRWFALQVTPFARGSASHVVVAHENITRYKQSEMVVRESREQLRAVLDTAADAIITIDDRGIMQSVNRAAEILFGYFAAEMVGQNVSMLMPSPFREQHDSYLRRYRETGVSGIIGTGREVIGQRKDGSRFPADLSVSEIPHLKLFTGIVHDITRRRELEREVVEIASLEQRRIGQDLHDSVGQELTALNLLASHLAKAVRTDPAGSEKLIERMVQGLRRSHKELRTLMRGLLPVSIDTEGLMAALADLADRTRNEGKATCTFDCPRPVSVADNLTATHLYLIAQEAVHNALKHARPSNIRIALERNHLLILRVQDDGIGIPVEPTEAVGLGLRIMRNRAAIIGAKLSVEPAMPTGTVVTCILVSRSNEGHHNQ